MRFMSDFREAMWGVVQQAISELDFDFDDYARRALRRGSSAPRPTRSFRRLERWHVRDRRARS